MATEFWSPAQIILGPFVFSFQFLALVSLEYWQNGLYKLSNEVIQKIWNEKSKFWRRFDKVRKSKMAPHWRHVTSQLSYDSGNRFISRRLISGKSFMFISSIVFKKWRGAFDNPLPVQGRPKKPSLNRVKLQNEAQTKNRQNISFQRSYND